ncbi:MAG: aldo/keto reductase, partial [Rhodoferax sp.]|nr:aldo/keto reductase [Rhodoferax sp.]
ARSYGFGQAERVLGAFAKGRRDKVTITTKFGVMPPNLSLRTKVLIPIARQVTKLVPSLKARLKSKSGQMLADRNFDVVYARKCLDQSLAELGTDYIDIYLVHEPVQTSTVNPDELQRLMEDSVKAGKIRRWGYALQAPSDYAWAAAWGGNVTQFEGNFATLPVVGPLLGCTAQRIVTRPFSGGGDGSAGLEGAIKQLGLDIALNDMGASVADVSLCVGRALSGQRGSVLCSMFSIHHIQANVQALSRFERDPRMEKVVSAVVQTFAGVPAISPSA